MTRLARLSAGGLGLVFGVLIVLTPSTCRSAPLWAVWASLAIALTFAAGVVFGYGLARWADLRALCPIRIRDVIVPAASLVAVAVVMGLAGRATLRRPEPCGAPASAGDGRRPALRGP